MKKIKVLVIFLWVFSYSLLAQTKELKGQLVANDEVDGLHIQNKTSAKYSISNADGSFIIEAKALDTLVISGITYQTQEFVITNLIVELGHFKVKLLEHVSELNEVVVGKVLTGSLESDISNSDAETEVNFYDLGIPGYTGKPLTQNERKLHDADAGPMGYIGLGGGVNLHKLLNKISGRTKKLKAIVELDKRDACIKRVQESYGSILFEKDTLNINLRTEYYLFCQEDEEFLNLCNAKNELKLIEFLQAKLKAYQENRKSVTED
ncbi:peptidase associated/transthyretin-like domain-containing protein [Winogradskyella endarachnes]|uniref:Carboxypeptidase-like regulatory domain-containing protein n=1 Tax=Winogradskyella endarachnes TaxID=2681965 RepID=A0A6L6U8W6_9FLAO|nr:hypothetical protein [Winogradskyella endarachnes]MUU77946.1 hypothetical protein [Winogradskyella endarachnes]